MKRLAVLCCVVMLIAGGTWASADYYLTDVYPGRQEVADTYQVREFLDCFGEGGTLRNPQDLQIGKDDRLYILDSDNARVLILNAAHQLERIIEGEFGGKVLNAPGGIFVDEKGQIFIADTGNNRVVMLDNQGTFQKEYLRPADDTYDGEYEFKPTRIAVDTNGRLYIVNKMDYHGLISLDEENQFVGYIGMTRVKVGIAERLIRVFATAEQREQLARSTPAYLTGLTITRDNQLYAVSNWEPNGQLKRLTAAGNNLFPAKSYGETNKDVNYGFYPAFCDVAVDNNGIVYAADSALSKVYVYDGEGNSLAVLGGEGTREGRFSAITALDVDNRGDIYVLDGTTGVIQILEPTALMRSVTEAACLYNDGQYEEADRYWKQVLELDTTHYLANIGMAKTLYHSGEYRKALDVYREAGDQQSYSTAFSAYRLHVVRQYFVPVSFAVMAVLLGLILLARRLYGRAKAIAGNYQIQSDERPVYFCLSQALLVLFHPMDAFDRFQRERGRLGWWPPALGLILLAAVRLGSTALLHFPFTSEPTARGSDPIQTVSTFLLPFLAFVLIQHAMTAVSDGEQTLLEALYAALYAFVPYILFALPIAALSHAMCLREAGLYGVLQGGVLVWSVALLLVSGARMNRYGARRYLFVLIKTLFGMACLALILFLVSLVSYQLFRFIGEIFTEAAFLRTT